MNGLENIGCPFRFVKRFERSPPVRDDQSTNRNGCRDASRRQREGASLVVLPWIREVVPMTVSAPHYLLFSESRTRPSASGARRGQFDGGQWRFVLETVDGKTRFEAGDEESEAEESRLALLAVVRGLEALAQPSRVTVVTTSRYVSRGFLFGLQDWRANGWRWERFGEMTPIKNRDLWQRIDRAMQFHQVECRVWRFDMPDTPATAPEPATSPAADRRCGSARSPRRKPRARRHPVTPDRHVAASWGQVVREIWHRCRCRVLGGFRLEAA